MLSILIMSAVVMAFFTGSIWLLTASLSVLALKTFPILLVLLALGGAGFLVFKHYYRR